MIEYTGEFDKEQTQTQINTCVRAIFETLRYLDGMDSQGRILNPINVTLALGLSMQHMIDSIITSGSTYTDRKHLEQDIITAVKNIYSHRRPNDDYFKNRDYHSN